jgi:hypothetical protein
VTSRVGGDDDLDGDNGQETPTAGILAAAPRRTPRKPPAQADSVTAAPANGNGSGNGNGNGTDRTARGAAATSDAPAGDAATSEVKDMLLPASSTDTDTDTDTLAKADGAVSDDAAFDDAAFDSAVPEGAVPEGAVPESDGAAFDGAVSDATIADGVPAFPGDDLGSSRSRSPWQQDDAPSAASTAPASTAPASTAPASTAPAGNEAPTVSPAAFAWDMPDPPPNSPSSPARTFLRTGTSGRNQASARSSGSPGGAVKAPSVAPAEAPAAPRRTQKKASKRSARQAHLTVARVEPWSVMKFSFVVSLVAFVILFVAVSVLYGVLSGLGVFDSLQKVVTSVTSSQTSAGVNAAKWWSASRVLSYTALLGSLNIVLITAMSTIGAVVYNLTSRLVGGVEVTLRETE